jgi:guanine nucleotide-binding protein G(I)/G(S)/G(T) subunit beta-1
MYSLLCSKKPESPYVRDFAVYGKIGMFGGFASHLHEISSLTGGISDEKYRSEQHNKLGPVYTNRSLRGHVHPITATSWSATDSSLLVSVGKDSRLFLWDVGECTKLSQHHVGDGADVIMSVALSPSNELVACGGIGSVCTVLRRDPQGAVVDTGTVLEDQEGFIPSCAFLDNAHVLTGSGDGTCKIYDLKKPTASVATYTHEHEVMATAVLMQQDGTATQFYSAAGNEVALWDNRAPNGVAATRVALARADDITSLSACRSKDHLVACGTEGGDVYVYDMRSAGDKGDKQRCLAAGVDSQITQAVSSVAFAHSGSMVFAGYREWVKRYMDCVLAAFDVSEACYGDKDGDNGSEQPILAPHCVIGSNPGITSTTPFTYSYQHCHGSFVSGVQINCDGCALATASHDGTITIFRQQR